MTKDKIDFGGIQTLNIKPEEMQKDILFDTITLSVQ